MKISNRVEQLRKNFRRMFGVQVFLNLHFLNVVTTIFYLHRGLSMVQIFYLGVAFSVINLIFEVPSSYLADKWGRKNTIILGCVFMLFQKIIYFSADSFFGMVSAIGCYALAYALFTGTDEALIYDTARELGEDQKTLTRLGSYFSAQRFAKILSPIIGAVIANNLLDWQFQVVIGLDALTVLVGFILATQLIEPYHRTDVEKQQSGVFRDAVALVSRNTYLLRLLLNKTLIFSASFVIWRMHQQFFIDRGVSLITLGVIVGLGQGIAYLGGKNINKIFPHHTLAARINFLNYIFTAFIILFTFATWIYPTYVIKSTQIFG